MTEKLLTGTLSLNTTNQIKSVVFFELTMTLKTQNDTL